MADRSDDIARGRDLRDDDSVRGVGPGLADTNLIGRSPVMVALAERLRKVAGCDATTLIEGETGTGKELAARAIHYLGARRTAPFVPVNCGAIPDTLVESEFFGYVRGAFTDAREARAGVIAQAEGGTLFLDEIEAMPLRAQVALLRFLNDREYRPVGGTPRSANVRVVAASNDDLESCARRGAFRHDLLYRLKVLPLTLPPLRARADDVVLLAEAFIARFCREYARGPMRLDAVGIVRLRRHSWPGNVRELENLVHREVLLGEGPTLRLDSLVEHPAPPLAGDHKAADGGGDTAPGALSFAGKRFQDAKASVIAQFEKAYLTELLVRTHGNISLASRISGKERSELGKLARKYGLARGQFS